jgi:hypothetical protein
MDKNLNPFQLDNGIVAERKAEQQKEYKLYGTITVPRGMKLYGYDPKKAMLGEVKRTPIDTCNFVDALNHKEDIAEKKSKAESVENRIYILAINRKNAIRKLIKLGNELENQILNLTK